MSVPEELDGRRLRSSRTRDAVVDAMLDLLRAGDLRPGARAIAERAGVSLRTVFRHFDDLDDLYRTAVAHQAERIEGLFGNPPVGGSLHDRIAALVRQRAALYEEITPVRRAAVLHAPFQEPIRDNLRRVQHRLRRQLEAVFAQELDACRARDTLLDALDVATSWSTWEQLRGQHARSVARAEATVAFTITALLSTEEN